MEESTNPPSAPSLTRVPPLSWPEVPSSTNDARSPRTSISSDPPSIARDEFLSIIMLIDESSNHPNWHDHHQRNGRGHQERLFDDLNGERYGVIQDERLLSGQE